MHSYTHTHCAHCLWFSPPPKRIIVSSEMECVATFAFCWQISPLPLLHSILGTHFSRKSQTIMPGNVQGIGWAHLIRLICGWEQSLLTQSHLVGWQRVRPCRTCGNGVSHSSGLPPLSPAHVWEWPLRGLNRAVFIWCLQSTDPSRTPTHLSALPTRWRLNHHFVLYHPVLGLELHKCCWPSMEGFA
jgi:hypothetical protein